MKTCISGLVLRLHNAKNLSDARKLLANFKDYLSDYPPSLRIVKTFFLTATRIIAEAQNRRLSSITVVTPVFVLGVAVVQSTP